MRTITLISTLLMIVLTTNMHAQENEKRFGFELSGGISFATEKVADAKLNAGPGFEGIFHYNFLKHTSVYAGWGWNHFASEESFAGNDVGFEETGYVFGLQFKHPVRGTALSWFARAGGIYNHIEIENNDGEIILDSGHGFGWQAAAGIDVNLGSNWSLTPGVKFNALSREIETEGVNYELDHQYLQVRVGVLKKF